MEETKRNIIEKQTIWINPDPQKPLMNKFKDWETLNKKEHEVLLNNQLTKIWKARKHSYQNLSLIENQKLKTDLGISLKHWEHKEIQPKIKTWEQIEGITLYLPEELRNWNYKKYTEEKKKQYFIDENQETTWHTNKISKIKKEEEIHKNIKETKSFTSTKQEKIRNINKEAKHTTNQISRFFKRILRLFYSLLKSFTNIYKPRKRREKQNSNNNPEIVKWKKTKNWWAEAEIRWEIISFQTDDINHIIWNSHKNIERIWETIIQVDSRKYIIKNGRIYDWNKTMEMWKDILKKTYSYQELQKIQKLLQPSWENNIQNFNYKNYSSNMKILSWLIILWKAQKTNIRPIKLRELKEINKILTTLKLRPNETHDNMSLQALEENTKNYKSLFFSLLKKWTYIS
jgi:hypothetical protein